MALSTYSELQASIADWLNRTDLTTAIVDFITLAEAQFNRTIRVSQMEQRATTNTVAGDGYLSLPADYLMMRNIQLNSNPVRSLDYLTPEEIDKFYDSSESSKPAAYTIVGNEFQLAPTPDAAYEVEISYYQKIAALSDTNTSNWLLESYPDMYLYGALIQAEPYLKNDQRIILWKSALQLAQDELIKADRKHRWSGSSMRIMNA